LNWIDILLLFLVLGAGAAGYSRGFIRSVRTVGSVVVGFFAARFICATQAAQIEDLFKLRSKVSDFFRPLAVKALETLPSSEGINPSHIMEALRVPAVLRPFLTNPAQQAIAGLNGSADLSVGLIQSNLTELLTDRLTDMATRSLIFLGSWLLTGILLYWILTLIIPTMRNTLIRSADRLAGMSVGAALEALMLVCVIGVLFPIASASQWMGGSSNFFASGVQDSFFIPWMTRGFQKLLLHWIMPLF
jgi:uncharacterized membrane protein required for colicin V production